MNMVTSVKHPLKCNIYLNEFYSVVRLGGFRFNIWVTGFDVCKFLSTEMPKNVIQNAAHASVN